MTNTIYAVVDVAGNFKKSGRFDTAEFASHHEAEIFRASLPNPADYTVQSFIEGQNFDVVVGNIGTVYSGNDSMEAKRIFEVYKQLSIDGYGRVAFEPVTMMRNNEPWIKHEGSKGSIETVEIREGYGARIRVPGYTDCTEWIAYDEDEEA